MKILIVSAVFPPKISATAALICKLLPHLLREGFEVDALTVKENFSDKDYTIFDSVRVFRADCVLQAPTDIRSTKDFLYKAKKYVDRRFHPRKENARLYETEVVNAFLSKMRRISAERYDCIVAVSAYYDAAEAMKRFKIKYAPRVPVILYQVDPLAENLIYQNVPMNLALYENELYKLCEHVFTTPVIYRLKEKAGWDVSKITPLEFPTCFQEAERNCISDEINEIKCIYAGYLYGGIRDASFTLQLFSMMQDPRIHLYFIGRGQKELLEEYSDGCLKGRLHLLGEMSSEDCDELLSKGDVLINIGNRVNNQVPSKIIHYVGFGKPILNMVAIEDCPSLPYMSRYPLAKNVMETNSPERKEASEAEKWILDSAGKSVSSSVIGDLFYDCTPEYVSEKIAQTLKGIRL